MRRLNTQIWGVVNVTPDSFSDGGKFFAHEAAVAHAKKLLFEGAHVLDVGGESSRPAGNTYGEGATQVPEAVEAERVVPVIRTLAQQLRATVSVDTVKPAVADAACEAGATFINDVSCGADEALFEVAARRSVDLVIMHTRDKGAVTAKSTAYADVVEDVIHELMTAAARALRCGVSRERVWIDPGIGFAKTAEQNLALLIGTARLVATGYRVLVGPSRKSFIAELAPMANGEKPPPPGREGGTAVAVAMAVMGGAHAVRVHDVTAMRQAAFFAEAWKAGSAT